MCLLISKDYTKPNQLEDLGVDGRIVLRWVYRKLDFGEWTGLIWLRIGTCGGYL